MSDVLPGLMRERVFQTAMELVAIYPDDTVTRLAGRVAAVLNLNSAAERAAVLAEVVAWDCEDGDEDNATWELQSQ